MKLFDELSRFWYFVFFVNLVNIGITVFYPSENADFLLGLVTVLGLYKTEIFPALPSRFIPKTGISLSLIVWFVVVSYIYKDSLAISYNLICFRLRKHV